MTVCRPGSVYAEIAALDELEVRMLAVAPAAQGQGIGVALMDAVHQHCDRRGFLRRRALGGRDECERGGLLRRAGICARPERDWQPVADVTLQVWRWPVPD